MASRCILLLPLGKQLPSGSFHVEKDVRYNVRQPCHRLRFRQQGTQTYQINQSLTDVTIYQSPLTSRFIFSKNLKGKVTGAVNGDRFHRHSIICCSGGNEGIGHESINIEDVTHQMRLLLETESPSATTAASSLVNSMTPTARSVLISALFPATQESVDHFQQADTNADGMVDATEFANFVETQTHLFEESNKPLTSKQLYHLGTRAAIGMVGFGFTDNAIMILAGDLIQNSIGITLGLSSLMSAGLGNAVADFIGTAFRGYIERLSSKFMPDVKISTRQMQSKEAWWAETVGASAGVTVGCLLGLAPLIFLQRTDGGTTSGSTVIALAGKDVRGNLSQPEDAAVVCSKPEAVERGGETVFATISTVATPKFQGLGLAQNLGGTCLSSLM